MSNGLMCDPALEIFRKEHRRLGEALAIFEQVRVPNGIERD